MIITLNPFGRGFSPLSTLNIKLPSFTVLGRKERKEDTQYVTGLTEIYLLIPQVRPAHKYPNSPWEMIHLPVGDNSLCAPPYTVYAAVCNRSLTATYQC
jgi:hypothetical protein